MSESTIASWSVIGLGALLTVGAIVMATQPKPAVIHLTKTSSEVIDSLYKEIYLKDSIISTWEDHAIRLKRIAGVKDTVSWSYKQKVIHPVDTRKITSHGRNTSKKE